jgi:hypothetical protein
MQCMSPLETHTGSRAGRFAHELRAFAAESAHRVTGVASFILLADIGDQRLRTLQLNFEGGDQRIFGINNNVFRFPLKFKANRKLHLCSPHFREK